MGELAVLIPIIALMIPFWAIHHGTQLKRERMRMEFEARGHGDLGTDIKARLERIEERVAVLERIATDPKRKLADEIDGLR